ncbi:unnamed protein product [Trichogramma brassicae]|uniref:60S ribosomal protein L36 n=1 Tax=Trichogramma brassicae TaxID=86971 RepID=A0A6H5IUX7_9HYME|nr:unnamed protein product [Trichogramma brassicae]
MAPRIELAIGLNKGHKTTKIRVAKNLSEKDKTVMLRPARLKGRQTKHSRFVRDLIREISGHSPYEKRALELLKVSKDKRTLKFLKTRLEENQVARIKTRVAVCQSELDEFSKYVNGLEIQESTRSAPSSKKRRCGAPTRGGRLERLLRSERQAVRDVPPDNFVAASAGSNTSSRSMARSTSHRGASWLNEIPM